MSQRVEKAAAGIESDIVSLTERLQNKSDIDQEIRLLEALLFAAFVVAEITEWYQNQIKRRQKRHHHPGI